MQRKTLKILQVAAFSFSFHILIRSQKKLPNTRQYKCSTVTQNIIKSS